MPQHTYSGRLSTPDPFVNRVRVVLCHNMRHVHYYSCSSAAVRLLWWVGGVFTARERPTKNRLEMRKLPDIMITYFLRLEKRHRCIILAWQIFPLCRTCTRRHPHLLCVTYLLF